MYIGGFLCEKGLKFIHESADLYTHSSLAGVTQSFSCTINVDIKRAHKVRMKIKWLNLYVFILMFTTFLV